MLEEALQVSGAFYRKYCRVPLILLGWCAAVAVMMDMARIIHEWPMHHFAAVVPGAIYRGGQPFGEDLDILHERYGVRTMINLRGNRDMPTKNAQIEFCRRNGIEFINLPIGPDRPTEAQLRTILEAATDPARQPVFIHCEAGSQRTGVSVAAYRMLIHGWSCEQAVDEAHFFTDRLHESYLEYLKALEPTDFSPAGTDPTIPLRHAIR